MAFIPNPVGIAKVVHSPGVARLIGKRTEQAAVYARATAPVRTGAYRASIHSGLREGTHGIEGFVASDSPYWLYVEFGTSDTPTFATLRNSLRAARF